MASTPLVQPPVTYPPTFGQSGASLEITNQELEPDILDPTIRYKYPSLGMTSASVWAKYSIQSDAPLN